MSIKLYSLKELTALTGIESLGHHVSERKSGFLALYDDMFKFHKQDSILLQDPFIRHKVGPSNVRIEFKDEQPDEFKLSHMYLGNGNETVFKLVGDKYQPVIFRKLTEDGSPYQWGVAEANLETGQTTYFNKTFWTDFNNGMNNYATALHGYAISAAELIADQIVQAKKLSRRFKIADQLKGMDSAFISKLTSSNADKVEVRQELAEQFKAKAMPKSEPAPLEALPISAHLGNMMKFEMENLYLKTIDTSISEALQLAGVVYKFSTLEMAGMVNVLANAQEQDKLGDALYTLQVPLLMRGTILSAPEAPSI